MNPTIEAGIAASAVLVAVIVAAARRPSGRRDYDVLLGIEVVTVFAFIAVVLLDMSRRS